MNSRSEHFTVGMGQLNKKNFNINKNVSPHPHLLNQNLWGKGMCIFIFNKHPYMILIYTEV